jgi:hypothetical protein
MYIYIYMYIYVYIYTYIYIHVYIHMFIDMHMNICMYTYIQLCGRRFLGSLRDNTRSMLSFMYVYSLYIYLYSDPYVYIYIHTHKNMYQHRSFFQEYAAFTIFPGEFAPPVPDDLAACIEVPAPLSDLHLMS